MAQKTRLASVQSRDGCYKVWVFFLVCMHPRVRWPIRGGVRSNARCGRGRLGRVKISVYCVLHVLMCWACIFFVVFFFHFFCRFFFCSDGSGLAYKEIGRRGEQNNCVKGKNAASVGVEPIVGKEGRRRESYGGEKRRIGWCKADSGSS